MRRYLIDYTAYLLVLGMLLGGMSAGRALAQDQAVSLQLAKGEKLSEAMGHYGRSRALLVAAINEFDEGLKLVNPDAMLDIKIWRGTLLERSAELGRLLDPQPRKSQSGVAFQPDSRLLRDPVKKGKTPKFQHTTEAMPK